jgi:hypothetical protein
MLLKKVARNCRWHIHKGHKLIFRGDDCVELWCQFCGSPLLKSDRELMLGIAHGLQLAGWGDQLDVSRLIESNEVKEELLH